MAKKHVFQQNTIWLQMFKIKVILSNLKLAKSKSKFSIFQKNAYLVALANFHQKQIKPLLTLYL